MDARPIVDAPVRVDAASPDTGPAPAEAPRDAAAPDAPADVPAPPPDARLPDAGPSPDLNTVSVDQRPPAPDAALPDLSPDLPKEPPDGAADTAAVDAPCPADPDLALCLRMDSNGADESPARLATVTTMARFEPGRDGHALSAGNTIAPVRVTPTRALALSRFTVEVWVLPRSVPGAGTRAGILDDSQQYSVFVYPGGQVRFHVSGDPILLGGALQAGLAWTHLALTYDGDVMTVFVNGLARASQRLGPKGPHPVNEFGLVVGSNDPSIDNPDPDPFDGLIDDVRVWRRVRTPAEICRAVPGCM